MRAAVIVFPGSNCDRDLAVAFREASGVEPVMVWHQETSLPEGIDIVGIPGGFSFGDYLRCGAIAGNSPICREVAGFAAKGGPIIGICNGFQVLTETGLLPGVLMRNAGIKFVCKDVALDVATTDSMFTSAYKSGAQTNIPVAHHDGNYFAPPELLKQLQAEDRVAFRYRENINGSTDNIAGVLSENRRVLGMMPHPERAVDPLHGGTGGAAVFASMLEALAPV
ncbi:MAG: phosphoribosylformylglycinamidine synthase subunit PurQ [Mangrovicoccus sp.]